MTNYSLFNIFNLIKYYQKNTSVIHDQNREDYERDYDKDSEEGVKKVQIFAGLTTVFWIMVIITLLLYTWAIIALFSNRNRLSLIAMIIAILLLFSGLPIGTILVVYLFRIPKPQ